MRPAFSSLKQAIAFALLLLVVLLSPFLVAKRFLPPREQGYSNLSWYFAPYPWVEDQVFQETNTIDIAFMGSSRMMRDIDTPYVEASLSKKLGRPAVVRTLAWNWPGYDFLYLVARDLLQHRHVRMLVFYDEYNTTKNHRNPALVNLFRYSEDSSLLAPLNLQDKSTFYFASLVGMPRNLLSMVRPNMRTDLYADFGGIDVSLKQHLSDVKFLYDASRHLGAVPTSLGYKHDGFIPIDPFVPTQTSAIPVAVHTVLHPDGDFEFSPIGPPFWQIYFCRQFATLAERQNCKLVMLHLPSLDSHGSTTIQERANWPAVISTNIVLVGVVPSSLFSGLSNDEIRKLYYDNNHFNQNGMEYFTRTITPALIQEFVDATKGSN